MPGNHDTIAQAKLKTFKVNSLVIPKLTTKVNDTWVAYIYDMNWCSEVVAREFTSA